MTGDMDGTVDDGWQTARLAEGIAPHWLDGSGRCVRCGVHEPAEGSACPQTGQDD